MFGCTIGSLRLSRPLAWVVVCGGGHGFWLPLAGVLVVLGVPVFGDTIWLSLAGTSSVLGLGLVVVSRGLSLLLPRGHGVWCHEWDLFGRHDLWLR